MRTVTAFFLLLLSGLSPANAADRMIIVNDAEMKALMQLIDAAVRANGVQAMGAASMVIDKLNKAGVVQSQTPVPDAPPAEEKPKEPPK
jgi:hypothetical protein